MKHYQLVVSIDGKFLFRTDWEHDYDRVMESYNQLVKNLELKVTMYSRDSLLTLEIESQS